MTTTSTTARWASRHSPGSSGSLPRRSAAIWRTWRSRAFWCALTAALASRRPSLKCPSGFATRGSATPSSGSPVGEQLGCPTGDPLLGVAEPRVAKPDGHFRLGLLEASAAVSAHQKALLLHV